MDGITKDGLIGVDGGGTACRFALVHRGQRVEFRSGSANIHSDPAAALQTLQNGLASLAERAGLALQDMSSFRVYLGLAGALNKDQTDTVIKGLPFARAVVSDDRVTTVTGALGSDNGIVIGIGTGSFFARQHHGKITLIGGWGLALGDEASGAYLGRQVLQKTLHVADGLQKPSGLTDAVFTHFENNTAAIVEFAAAASPKSFATFAPWVINAARDGDVVGRGMMQDGAASIRQRIERLEWQPQQPICAIGGIARFYRDYLPDPMATSFTDPKGTALDGALYLASQLPEPEGTP